MLMKKKLLTLAFVFCIIDLSIGLDNGLALTPQMGWNSWNHFGCNVNQTVIVETARALVSTGLAAKGYVYTNVDDCWAIARNPITNVIVSDPVTFPSGMEWLAVQIHNLGLRLGVYSDAGNYTCDERPGSLGFEKVDADTYAKWGIDYLKYDNCWNDDISPKIRYPIMRDALNKSGRHIFFSMCEWGVEDPWKWAKNVGNSWRTTGDIQDFWDSFVNILDQNAPLYKYAGPGGWNDPDMLEVGNGGMTHNEYQCEFALWALMKAPLLIGCDVTRIDKGSLEILKNEEIIAINQDPLGIQGRRVQKHKLFFIETEVWSNQLVDGYAVILFNRGRVGVNIKFNFKKAGWVISDTAHIRDLVQHKNLGTYYKQFNAFVQPRSVKVLKLTQATETDEIFGF